MKIKPAHLGHMRQAIEPLNTAETRALYGNISAEQYRWNLLWRSGLNQWVCDKLYSYANDSHIDTALKAIVKE